MHNIAKVMIISQAFHHLEKSILLKNTVLKDSVILNFYQDKEKLSSLKGSFNQEYIHHLDTPEKIESDLIKNVKGVLGVSLSPHLSYIKLIDQIRRGGKKIVLIRENHQDSIHQGSVN